MNVNVLKITSTPIKLQMTSERARLEVQAPESDAMASRDLQGQLNMKSQNIKVDIDSSRTQNGMAYQASNSATARYMKNGAKGQASKMPVEIPGLAVDFKPRMVEAGSAAQAPRRTVKYVPGELKVSVEQTPKVEIEYVGDPIYFPKSASEDDGE